MANFSDQIKEIQTLLSSTAATDKSQKPVAYSTLLHLQEQSSSATCDLPLIQWLADASLCLLPLILTDIFDDDEEIAAQALKCLGFMIYHPTLLAAFSSDDANLIVNSLTKVIITTKIKAVCNLGVWCLSVQQFPSIYLAANFNSLLRAIVHALDNPLGSLSTTFEATQAVIKLAAQLNEKMRDTSNIWAPPIYRRSFSVDKRVRDISERCLLKIRSTICPPSLSLSKAIVIDLKGTLLPGMKELLNHGLKIQAIQAWGWFIRLLGPYALKNRHLVNEMLKIPEQTFPDADPQVQIASLVAWEGLIDALIEHGRTCNGNDSGTGGQTHSKSIKLIMAPITGIMSSRCDQSVYSSCLNTWCYLLHTLDASVNSPSLIKTAWEPVFDAVFRVTPDSKSIRGWITCLDLLEDFVLAKGRELESDMNDQVNYQLSAKTPTTGPPIPSEQPWKHYPIKWMPCDLNKLDFCFKVIENFLSRGRGVNDTEVKCLVHDSALRIFRSVMKGVRCVLNNSSMNYDEILLCLNKTFELLKVISESIISENTDNNHLRLTALQFVGAVVEEIEPSIIGSPLYKVALDLKYFDNSANMTKHGEVIGVQFKVYMDMVSPIFYLLNLYFCGVFNSTFDAPGAEFIMQDACRYVKFVLSTYEPSEIIHGIMGLMYKHVGFDYLKVWVAISKGLIEYVDEVKDISLLTLGSDMSKCSALCQLLFYPFAVCLVRQERPTTEQCTGIQVSADVPFQSHRQLELELVFDVWKALYAIVNHANRSENSTSSGLADQLALALNGCLDEDMKVLECGSKINPSNSHQNHDLLFLYGNVVICVLEDIQISAISSTGSIDRDDGDQKESSVNILRLTARFMTLARKVAESSPPLAIPPLIPRVFSTLVHFVGHLHMKKDVLSFVQIISNPLLQWITTPEELCEDANCQLQLLWTEILNRLQKSCPPFTFDSSFLELQAPLLERTLIHPNLSISNPTISFWNSTYATEKLGYPQSLIPVLDKLSRQGKISLFKRGIPYHSRLGAPPRYQVSTVTQHRSSKRVELSEDIGKKGSLGLKRKSELTEHQKEVRRAQQGRERDCSGHGPGIRTYTALDFSQGNEESQDSQDIRDAEAILELLRRSS